jgi:hypothetical protein
VITVHVVLPIASERRRLLKIDGWTTTSSRLDRGDGYCHLTKTFAFPSEAEEQMNEFTDARITSWLS